MIIDLRSDTVTKPCSNMRKAMANAIVGDDVLGDDPTIQLLEERIADIVGKETALFVPSGTMANQIAIWLHTRRGDSIAVEQDAHIFHYEAGGPSVLSSTMMRPINGNRGIMDIDSLASCFVPVDPHFAPVTLVCVEDTANRGGGSVYPLDTLDSITRIARKNKSNLHLDGARLFNAQAASGIPVKTRAQHFDTVSICFSKGLGAPVGSALCFSKARIDEARRVRKVLGGGMRQSGILAAAALYALENNVTRLEEDHYHIELLSTGLKEAGYKVRPSESNMVYFEAKDPDILIQKVQKDGIRGLALGPTTIRLVAHLQINRDGIQKTIQSFLNHAPEHI
jgi:threonine aldolase